MPKVKSNWQRSAMRCVFSSASGTPGSAERKYRLLNALGLPPRLSKKELVEALNRLYSFEQLDALQGELRAEPES